MRSLLAVVLLAAVVTAAPAGADDMSLGASAPVSALAHRGFVTTRAAAERAIAFRPFVPDAAPAEVALLAPFHGSTEISAHDGIAYAYGRSGRAWVLSEWPRNGGDLRAFAPLPAERDCTDVHAIGGRAKPRGIVWSTPRGLVFSLTPGGSADPRTIFAEFRRLLRRGACR